MLACPAAVLIKPAPPRRVIMASDSEFGI